MGEGPSTCGHYAHGVTTLSARATYLKKSKSHLADHAVSTPRDQQAAHNNAIHSLLVNDCCLG